MVGHRKTGCLISLRRLSNLTGLSSLSEKPDFAKKERRKTSLPSKKKGKQDFSCPLAVEVSETKVNVFPRVFTLLAEFVGARIQLDNL